jgi:archaemetzincin
MRSIFLYFLLMSMRILVVLLGRTMPGFHPLLDSISREFGAKVTTELIDVPFTRSFRSRRNQYDAGVMLKELAPMVSHYADKALFITRDDLFGSQFQFIFGMAKGKNCIVSLARLDPRFYGPVRNPSGANALFKERIHKEVLHELGHTLGLEHCRNRKCVMAFSGSFEGIDRKGKSFCGCCKQEIKTQSRTIS